MKTSKYMMALVVAAGLNFPLQAATSSAVSPHPLAHSVNLRLKTEWKEIQLGVKSGKISKSQGDSLRAQLKGVRQQETAFFKQNNNHEITADQQTQLNASLDKTELAISGKTTTN
jgi:hypothetical protein